MDLEELRKPLEYAMNTSGKNTRGLFLEYIQGLLCNSTSPNTKLFAEDIDIIHNASLVIDDIQDESEKRRGQTCAHLVYGTPLALNASYLGIFEMLENINGRYPDTISNKVRTAFIKSLRKGHIGQGLDLLWTKNRQIVAMDDYHYMVDNKTGFMFHLVCELCLICKGESKYSNEVLSIAKHFGRFFQIRDDYINLTSPSYWSVKGFCGDFDERKSSYVFARVNELTRDNSIFEELCACGSLTRKRKMQFYELLYQSRSLHEVYYDLERSKQEIIRIEKQITNADVPSEFLSMIFKKLEYNLPMRLKLEVLGNSMDDTCTHMQTSDMFDQSVCLLPA